MDLAAPAAAERRSAHVDTFAADHLPPRAQWPQFVFDLPELQYPPRLNCATELLTGAIERRLGRSHRAACARRPAVDVPAAG